MGAYNHEGMLDRHMLGEGIKFERIRRITGYLVGTTDRWNTGKQCEERDRVKHGVTKATAIHEESRVEIA